MLIAISGSQGSGKSTVINTLKDRGYPVVEGKTSRSILEEWNVTLSQVNNDRELTVRFQDEILQRKINDDTEMAKDPSRIVFTERTLADFFTYALVAIGKDNEYSEWVNDYFDRCVKAQQIYSHNFYLTKLNKTEHDGVRGSNQHYANMVDVVMKSVLSDMYKASYTGDEEFSGPETTVITMRDNEARVNEILRNVSRYL